MCRTGAENRRTHHPDPAEHLAGLDVGINYCISWHRMKTSEKEKKAMIKLTLKDGSIREIEAAMPAIITKNLFIETCNLYIIQLNFSKQ